jgi:hypothetical protein
VGWVGGGIDSCMFEESPVAEAVGLNEDTEDGLIQFLLVQALGNKCG